MLKQLIQLLVNQLVPKRAVNGSSPCRFKIT